MSARRSAVLFTALALTLTGLPVLSSGGGGLDPAAAEAAAGEVFVNEIHYANTGVDAGEFVELAGPAGADLTGYDVVLYDGETGAAYASTPLTTSIGPNGIAVVDYPVEGVRDGSGGVALVKSGTVDQFLSWGGAVTATDGPAAGRTSDGIGVAEDESTAPDASLQLTGTGDVATDFTWSGPAPGSRGAPNAAQTLTADGDESLVPGLVDDTVEPGDVVDTFVRPSDPANELYIEGESLVPSATGTPVISQDSSGLLVWSDDRQLRVNAIEAFEAATVTFQVPREGRYVVSADMTAGQNFGVAQLSIDGAVAGEFDGSGTRNTLVRRHSLGEHDLAAGDHTLTMKALRAGSGGLFRIGLDVLRLRLQPPDGRLTLTPGRTDAVAGTIPVFGWSTDSGDLLRVEIDHEQVADWDAVADTATLVYEARGIDAGPVGAAFEDGISVRGHETIIDYDVQGGTINPNTNWATNGIQISGELLRQGANVIDLFAGSDERFGPNLDDFEVRNLRLVLGDGSILKGDDDPLDTVYRLGDNEPGAVERRSWTYVIPPTSGPVPRPARGYKLETQLLSDGDHVVTLTADGPAGTEKLHHHFTVDNNAPVVSDLSPADGQHVKGTFLLDATVTDVSDAAPEVVATLDGSTVELGQTMSTDDLLDGKHVFSVRATDAAGTSVQRTSTFTTVGETPDAPQLVAPADGSTGAAKNPKLQVNATDPAGEPLQVTFLQATPVGPPVLGLAGTSGGDVPVPAAGAGTPVSVGAATSSDDVYAESDPTSDSPFQRYDVRVSRVRGAKTVDLSWEGRVAADREVVLSVWNVETQRWTEVASSSGTDGADTTLVGRTRLGPTIDGDVVHVLVEARDTFAAIPSTADRTFENPASYDFAVAWMTDTQYLSQGATGLPPGAVNYANTFTAMTQWVKDNVNARHIVYSAHTGDVINNWQVTSPDEDRARKEFAFASKAMAILDNGGVPNGVTPGNHDNKTGTDNALFNEYFGPARYDAAEDIAPTGEDGDGYYGGPWQPGDNQNHYDLVEVGGQKLIFLYLGYFVQPEEFSWANQVLADYRDRAAVVLTHSYLRPSMTADGRGGELTLDDGEEIFDQVVVPNENVFLVLSGHTHGVGLNVKRDVGVKGHVVVEMLANHQFFELPNGQRRVGHLRLLQFDLDGRVSVNTYSPILNDHNAVEFDTQPGRHYDESADEFVVPVDLPGRKTTLRTDAIGVAVRTNTVIGTANVASGGVAEVTWNGLAAGTKYGWYARATDAGGFAAESTVFTFTTAGTTATTSRP